MKSAGDKPPPYGLINAPRCISSMQRIVYHHGLPCISSLRGWICLWNGSLVQRVIPLRGEMSLATKGFLSWKDSRLGGWGIGLCFLIAECQVDEHFYAWMDLLVVGVEHMLCIDYSDLALGVY